MPEAARAKRASSASNADTATTPTATRPRTSCGGGTHRICAWRVCISSPVKCEPEEGSRLPKIPVLQGGEDVKTLREAGWLVHDKRVERIWRREGLKVPPKQPKRAAVAGGQVGFQLRPELQPLRKAVHSPRRRPPPWRVITPA